MNTQQIIRELEQDLQFLNRMKKRFQELIDDYGLPESENEFLKEKIQEFNFDIYMTEFYLLKFKK